MRKPIIVGNWKMNHTCAETVEFIKAVEPVLNDHCTYGIGVPFTALKDATSNAKNLIIAAENCHYEESGAFTGEISIPMLKELNVSHCIVGHSERRTYYNETDESVNKKIHKLIEAGITPIMCCGETAAQFDAGETEKVLRNQVSKGLAGLDAEKVANLVIAYEPIWAIGTGKSANVEIAEKCCALVREVVKECYGEDAANRVRIQYGGSVKPNNIKEYLAMEDIDGALIGGASLKIDSFKALVEETK